MKAWGIHKITSDSLRQQISYLFDDRLAHLESLGDLEMQFWQGSYHDEVVRIFNFENPRNFHPVDYQQFVKDEAFANTMRFHKTLKQFNTSRRASIVREIITVRNNIAKELERLQ